MITPEDAVTEVIDLHTFFTNWFRGDIPATDDAFARFADAMRPAFLMVAPSGARLDREAVLDLVRPRHPERCETPAPDDFAIEIRRPEVRMTTSDLTIVTYEEWQRSAGRETARLSTAVLVADPDAPTGIGWELVHETWMSVSGS